MSIVKGVVVAGLLASVGLVAVVSLKSRAAAAEGGGLHAMHYSNRTIRGSYGFNTHLGMLMPPAVPEPVPATTLGRIVFDGDGGCFIDLWANIGGQTNRVQSATCSYAVNPDGTGTNEATFPDAPISEPIPIVFVIVDEGREIRLMNTTSIVATIVARRQ